VNLSGFIRKQLSVGATWVPFPSPSIALRATEGSAGDDSVWCAATPPTSEITRAPATIVLAPVHNYHDFPGPLETPRAHPISQELFGKEMPEEARGDGRGQVTNFA
jgi:hypothetical protein